MAVFEKTKKKSAIDDTIAISCNIETAQVVNNHTEYLLRSYRGIDKDNSWIILRRYNDFVQLNKYYSKCGIKLPIPGKKYIGNMRPDFVAERRQSLQVFINSILMNPILASSLPAKRFIDPDSYSQSFYDQAVQNIQLCLRGENTWILGSSLGTIGWRVRKHYFKITTKPPEKSSHKHLLKSGSQSKSLAHSSSSKNGSASGSVDINLLDHTELCSEWLEYGPDKYIDDKDIGCILKSIVDLQHPNIEPLIHAVNNENGGLFIRRFHKEGTLKDILCMSTPKNPFLLKYGVPKGRKALPVNEVAKYGCQILNALIFLHSKDFAYGHLHSGNVIIADGKVKLLDIENFILGVPAFYRPFFVQHAKLQSIEAVEVYCFGHVLFEMAMGYPLQESVVRNINVFPASMKKVLESILTKEACKTGLPSLVQLRNNDFFANVSTDDSTNNEKVHFKISLHAKEIVKQAQQKWETRLQNEQKSVKNQKRIVRVQELMSFEEEKRKSKQKFKSEHKSSKLRQQTSFQTNNGRVPLSSPGVSTTGPVILSRDDSFSSCNIQHNDDTPELTSLKETLPGTSQQTIDVLSRPNTSTAILNVERQLSSPNLPSDDQNESSRSALLESICKFNRGSLRKVRSND